MTNTLSKDIRIDLDSKIWGPNGWFFIDSISLSYPIHPSDIDKQQYKNFFYSFPNILPCSKCRIHFNDYINKNPLTDEILSSKEKLIKWILSSHNNIRDKQIDIEEFYLYYNDKYNINVKIDACKKKCGLKQYNNHNPNYYKYISIILLGIIVALSLYLLRTNQLK